MQGLFKKPKELRYVDMCIYIDDTIYTENPDYNKIYEYMYYLAYMLACKKRYFTTQRDYEEFAAFFAYDTYKRMTSLRDAPKEQRIKSVLNYMKSISYWRKCMYEAERHQEVLDNENISNWDSASYSELWKERLEANNHEIVENQVVELVKTLPKVISNSIPKIYKKDAILNKNIYISCLLSLISKFTLPRQSEEYLNEKIVSNPGFNDVKYYSKHLESEIILWNLNESMKPLITVILNKVSYYFIDEIRGLINDSKLSEDEFFGITSSSMLTGGKNDEANF